MTDVPVTLTVTHPYKVGDRVTIQAGVNTGRGATVVQHAEAVQLDNETTRRTYLHQSIQPTNG